MPDQRNIEEIKMAHLAAIQEVMARYPANPENRPVLLDEMGSVLVSPFGPVPHMEASPATDSHKGITQQLPLSASQAPETAEPGPGLSILALAGGLYLVCTYIRKMLE